MGRDYDTRLSRVLARRQNISFAADQALATLRESQWDRSNQKSVRYALLSMEALDPDYTQKSYEEGGRVIAQLDSALAAKGTPVAFEYQGSVPLNIHIKHQSDIDILALVTLVLTYDRDGVRANYYSSTTLSAQDEVRKIRLHSESLLATAYPAATVDTSGGKSISISGGSLSRKVDVVPAYWHDDARYQESQDKKNRVVCIYNKQSGEIIKNMPFLHMWKIDEKERASSGGAKKIIRLLKNVRADSEPRINLSSYDIASLVWHFDTQSMIVNPERDMTLVAVARDNLEFFVNNPDRAAALESPDGTRKILNEPAKFNELNRLYAEVNELSENIAEEIDGLRLAMSKATMPTNYRPAISNILRESYLPRRSR